MFILLLGNFPSVDFGIDSAPSSVIKKANVITLTRETASSSGKNFTTKLVTENVDGEVSEIAGESIRKQGGIFGNVRTDFNLEKVNFPENLLFYVNQGYLTIRKSRKIYYDEYHIIGQIIESSDPPVTLKITSEKKEK